MATVGAVEFLRYSDKLYIASVHYSVPPTHIALCYLGDRVLPVVELHKQQQDTVAWRFERCVFQVQQVKSQDQTPFVWGEAAETAKHVCYGQDVKLWNVFSNRYLTAPVDPPSEQAEGKDKEVKDKDGRTAARCLLTRGQPAPPPVGHPEENLHFRQVWRILPRHKSVREMGEKVRLQDEVVFELTYTDPSDHRGVVDVLLNVVSDTTSSLTNWPSHQEKVMKEKGVVTPTQYWLEVARGAKGRKADISASQCWKMEAYETEKDFERKEQRPDQYVLAGSSVLLFHREYKGFLLCDWMVQEAGAVCLDGHKIQKQTFNVPDLPYSSNALWIIEADNAKRGGVVGYGPGHRRKYRLRHMATGLYLCAKSWLSMDGTKQYDITTTYKAETHTDEGGSGAPIVSSLVTFHPLDSELKAQDRDNGLTVTSFVRIYFPEEGSFFGEKETTKKGEDSGVFLHANGDYSMEQPIVTTIPEGDRFKAASTGTTDKLQKMAITKDKHNEDVFAIRCVRPQERENLMLICNVAATMQRFVHYWQELNEKEKDRKEAETAKQKKILSLFEKQKNVKHATFEKSVPPQIPEELTKGTGGRSKEETMLHDLLRRTATEQNSARLVKAVVEVLTTLVLYCTSPDGVIEGFVPGVDSAFEHRGPPVRKNQQMLFQQNVHQLLFDILRAPEGVGIKLETILKEKERDHEYTNLRTIYRLGYRLVKQMVKGAKDLALHMSLHLPFIESQLALGAMPAIPDAYMQIICDNEKLLDKLREMQLTSYLWLIPQFGRKAVFMTLLSACCTCDGQAKQENQTILIKYLTKLEKLYILYPTKLDKDKGEIMVRQLSQHITQSAERKLRRFKKKEAAERVLLAGTAEEQKAALGASTAEKRDTESETPTESDSEEERQARPSSPVGLRTQIEEQRPPQWLVNAAGKSPAVQHILEGLWVSVCEVEDKTDKRKYDWRAKWKSNLWLRIQGGCLMFFEIMAEERDSGERETHDPIWQDGTQLDPHPRTIPIAWFHHIRRDSVGSFDPPPNRHGMALVYKDKTDDLNKKEDEPGKRRLLISCGTSDERNALLLYLRKEVKYSLRWDDTTDGMPVFDDPHEMRHFTGAHRSLNSYKTQMQVLKKRHGLGTDGNKGAFDDEGERGTYITLAQWANQALGSKKTEEDAKAVQYNTWEEKKLDQERKVAQYSTKEELRYFEQSLAFLSSICAGGNHDAHRFITKKLKICPDQMIAGMTVEIPCEMGQNPFTDPIRAGYVRLAKHMCIEYSRHKITKPETIKKLKEIVLDFLRNNHSQQASNTQRNSLTNAMLDLMNTMLRAGCYEPSELEDLLSPVLRLLDGTSDNVRPEDLASATGSGRLQHSWALPGQQQSPRANIMAAAMPGSPMAQSGMKSPAAPMSPMAGPMSPRDPGSPRTQTARNYQNQQDQKLFQHSWADHTSTQFIVRYERWSERLQLLMESKLACCHFLEWLFTEAGKRPEELPLQTWLAKVEAKDPTIGKNGDGETQGLDLDTDRLTQILLDTTMYKGYPKLFVSALKLAFVNLSAHPNGQFGDPNERELRDPDPEGTGDIPDEGNEIVALARVLRTDIMRRNRMLTQNILRHFRESAEDNLSMALMWVFTTIIHLPVKGKDGKEIKSNKEMERMQCLLDDLEVTPLITQLVESKDEDIVKEALRFGHAMLLGGNHKVQTSIMNYFASLNDEAFFSCMRERIMRSTKLIKDTEGAKQLGSHGGRRMDSSEGDAAAANAEVVKFDAAKKGMNISMYPELLRGQDQFVKYKCEVIGKRSDPDCVTVRWNDPDEGGPPHVRQMPQETEESREWWDSDAERGAKPVYADHIYVVTNLYHLEHVMRFLQLFCEGHNRQLQDYLREQGDNVHSYDLVRVTFNAMVTLLTVEHCDKFIYDHIKQSLDSLTEYCQGPCPDNQTVLVNANIASEATGVLDRTVNNKDWVIEGIPDDEQAEARDELSNTTLTMLLSVLEGVEDGRDSHIPTVIRRTLNFDLLRKLLDDVWRRKGEETAVNLGFTAVILVRTLCPFDETLKEWLEKCAGYSFYAALTGRIEINRCGSLVRVYFRIPFICANLSDKTKDELLVSVKRDTPTSRIADFFDKAEELIYEIEYYEKHFKKSSDKDGNHIGPNWGEYNRLVKYFVNSTIGYWEKLSILVAFITNILVMISYVTLQHADGHVSRKPLQGYHIESPRVEVAINVLMVMQTVVCTALLLDWLWAKAPLIVNRKTKKQLRMKQKKSQHKYTLQKYIDMYKSKEDFAEFQSSEYAGHTKDAAPSGRRSVFDGIQREFGGRCQKVGGAWAAINLEVAALVDPKAQRGLKEMKEKEKARLEIPPLTDADTGLLTHDYTAWETFIAIKTEMQFVAYVGQVIMAIFGLTVSPFFVCCHLLGIINMSALLQNVIKAVTKNHKSLLLTVLLGIIIIYIFSLAGFVFFREAFKNQDLACDGDNCEVDYHCDTLRRCFIFAVTTGIRQGGGIGDKMLAPNWNDPYVGARMVFDLGFYLVVVVILLNIIFGIIIDTFAELRADKQEIETDIKTKCFICGIESANFDRQAEGFEHHIKEDHNMWNYIFFIHHLHNKEQSEYTGQESFVYSMIKRNDMTFFPLNKALCLEGKQEDDDQMKELLQIHSRTDQRVGKVEAQVSNFQTQFSRENLELKEHLKKMKDEVIRVTEDRHAILKDRKKDASGEGKKDQQQDADRIRPLFHSASG